MKIKIKDERQKIKMNVTHKELLIINEALKSFDVSYRDYEEFNQHLFDADEFECNEQLDAVIFDNITTITKTLEKVDVF